MKNQIRLRNKEIGIKNSLESCKYLGSEVLYLDKTDSTMEDARKFISENAPDGTVIIAEEQTLGRGRYNRKWYSPKGGVYISLILYAEIEKEKQGILSLMAGVSSCESIREYMPDANIKWPNDVLVNEKKISGVLIEKIGNYYSIGTGINTNTDKFEGEFMVEPASVYLLSGNKIDNEDFIISYLKNFDENYSLLREKNYNLILAKWNSMASCFGKNVRLRNPMLKEKEKEVFVRSIDENGLLVVESDKGIEKIISGEIFY